MANDIVNLSKGGVVNLSKRAPGLKEVVIGLGWDPIDDETQMAPKKGGFFFSKLFGGGGDTVRTEHRDNIDCDAFAILLKNDKLVSNDDVVYFGNLQHRTKSVIHCGDNLTGEGEGDDENIIIKLDKVPDGYNKIIVAVNIYQAYRRNQTFGGIKNAFIRIVNEETHREMCRFDISDTAEYGDKTAVVFGALKKNDGEWEFEALGQGYRVENISELANQYSR